MRNELERDKRQSSPRTSLDVFSVTFHKIIRHCIYVIEYLVSSVHYGISVGGRIEFFVGTPRELEAKQNKKNKSGGFSTFEWDSAGA